MKPFYNPSRPHAHTPAGERVEDLLGDQTRLLCWHARAAMRAAVAGEEHEGLLDAHWPRLPRDSGHRACHLPRVIRVINHHQTAHATECASAVPRVEGVDRRGREQRRIVAEDVGALLQQPRHAKLARPR